MQDSNGSVSSAEQGSRTVVLVAHDVNMSIFKHGWITDNQIIPPDEILDDFLFSPAAIRIPTKNYELTIIPSRLQLSVTDNAVDITKCIQSVLVKIVDTLPHTPFAAAGLNHEFIISPLGDEAKYADWISEMYSSKYSQMSIGDEANSFFGSYFSFDFLDGRLKVDAKPVDIEFKNEQGEVKSARRIRIGINYHVKIPDSSNPGFVKKILSQWEQINERALKIIGVHDKTAGN